MRIVVFVWLLCSSKKTFVCTSTERSIIFDEPQWKHWIPVYEWTRTSSEFPTLVMWHQSISGHHKVLHCGHSRKLSGFTAGFQDQRHAWTAMAKFITAYHNSSALACRFQVRKKCYWIIKIFSPVLSTGHPCQRNLAEVNGENSIWGETGIQAILSRAEWETLIKGRD